MVFVVDDDVIVVELLGDVVDPIDGTKFIPPIVVVVRKPDGDVVVVDDGTINDGFKF